MSYDSLIKRIKKAIEVAENKEMPVSVHKVTVDDDISKLSGLVVILHPSYTSSKSVGSKTT